MEPLGDVLSGRVGEGFCLGWGSKARTGFWWREMFYGRGFLMCIDGFTFFSPLNDFIFCFL
jgi:hypothetical protein